MKRVLVDYNDLRKGLLRVPYVSFSEGSPSMGEEVVVFDDTEPGLEDFAQVIELGERAVSLRLIGQSALEDSGK